MGIISMLKKKVNKTLFTTPSHCGFFCIFHKFYQWYKYDISEVDSYAPQDALNEAERFASSIYKTKYTKFLTNGSTSGVIAAILACKPSKILIWDNAHQSHENGAILAGATVIKYSLQYDNELGVYRAITVSHVERLLQEYIPDVLLITSPTYEGFAADVETIASICKSKNVKLIVDEAHGALYPFSNKLPESAVAYADFTIQSLHKTAGGLNPTALLHSNDIDPTQALSMINTTSPSYPMLATIEANIKFLNSIKGKITIENLVENIKLLDIEQLNDDPTKILLNGGEGLSEFLYNEYNIEDERTNPKTTLLLCGIGTTQRKLQRLKKALLHFRQ